MLLNKSETFSLATNSFLSNLNRGHQFPLSAWVQIYSKSPTFSLFVGDFLFVSLIFKVLDIFSICLAFFS